MTEDRLPEDFDAKMSQLLEAGKAELEAELEDADQRVEVVVLTRRWHSPTGYLIEIDTEEEEDVVLAMLLKAQHQWLQGAWELGGDEDEEEED